MGHARPVNNRRIQRVGFFATAFCAFAAFGISGTDESAMRGFEEAARHWQANPEFRSISTDYCVRGSRALRTRAYFLRARSLVVAIRSAPFLPRRFAINPTSRAHYDNFGKGPLSAYLHLCSEQSVPEFARVLESVGRREEPSTTELRQFLDAFHMDVPVCTDEGALDSVRSLLHDMDARRPIAIRQNVGPLLVPHIHEIAHQLKVPEAAPDMSPEQQFAVLERLDAHVRRHDPELWRTKQLSDFCGGVWAQVFGPSYRLLIEPLILLHQAGQFLLIVLLARIAFVASAGARTNADRVRVTHPPPTAHHRARWAPPPATPVPRDSRSVGASPDGLGARLTFYNHLPGSGVHVQPPLGTVVGDEPDGVEVTDDVLPLVRRASRGGGARPVPGSNR